MTRLTASILLASALGASLSACLEPQAAYVNRDDGGSGQSPGDDPDVEVLFDVAQPRRYARPPAGSPTMSGTSSQTSATDAASSAGEAASLGDGAIEDLPHTIERHEDGLGARLTVRDVNQRPSAKAQCLEPGLTTFAKSKLLPASGLAGGEDAEGRLQFPGHFMHPMPSR